MSNGAGEVEATLPHSLVGFAGPGADARRITLEPVHAGVYHLTYACLLLPRFAADFLTGDVADKLSEWMPIICVAFGWRLEFLAVRPEYLQWVANVPPATSPGYVMRIMRQQTSQKLFSAFPSLKKDNPSGDFWAPGYLIMGGTQPHPSPAGQGLHQAGPSETGERQTQAKLASVRTPDQHGQGSHGRRCTRRFFVATTGDGKRIYLWRVLHLL